MKACWLGGLSIWCSVSVACAATPEVRGTWLTTTANDAINSPAKTADTMRRLREIGLNTVYVECWKNGYTEFPSETMQKLIGVPMRINAAPQNLQRDLLAEAVTEAHRNGLLAIAWFEYGFMAANQSTHNELRALGEKEGWLLQDSSGQAISPNDHFVWTNPLHPKPQQMLLDIVLEAARKYDLDGVQLDDRIAMPVELGYDDYTRSLYAKEHNGKPPPTDATNPEWIAWRASLLTAFAKRFSAAIHEVNPKLIVSVSPAPYPWCYEHYCCDWPTWMKWEGPERWDECVPQNYRLNFEKTKESIEEDLKPIGERRSDLSAGIRIVGDGPDLSAADLSDSIDFTRQAKLGGHVLWFSRGVLDAHSNSLAKLYDVTHTGIAPHPGKPADWRPLPIRAEPSGGQKWTAKIDQAGRYQMIIRQDGVWKVRKIDSFATGSATFEVESGDAVELLRERRP